MILKIPFKTSVREKRNLIQREYQVRLTWHAAMRKILVARETLVWTFLSQMI